MEIQETLPKEQERRSYVRAQDAIGLHIQRLTDMPAAGQVSEPPARARVRRQDKYAIAGYAEVRRDYPAVAGYIDELEERIRQLLLNGEESPARPTHKVSLSAGGIHFADRLLLHPGELISLTLTLFPSGQQIGTDARIISGNDAEGVARHGEPSYRAIFVRLTDEDRQAIDAHVRQLLEKRVVMMD